MPTRGRTYAQTMFFHLRHEIWSQPSRCVGAALSPIREPTAFSAEQARTAGSLVAQTRALALSLGDRACLALGLALKAPVYTADESWRNLKLGIRIHVIR